MKIYTRTGDEGETSLLGSDRVPKHDPRIAAYGTVDELSSLIGVVRAAAPPERIDQELLRIQGDLFETGALLASSGDRFSGVGEERVDDLEQSIDSMESELDPLTSFIFPGGTPSAASLHLARTVCRRAERCVSSLENEERTATTLRYLNRLSDWLFVAARFTNREASVEEIEWRSEK